MMRDTFNAHLRAQTHRYGDSRRYTFVTDGPAGLTATDMSFAGLDAAARAIAAWLGRHMDPGDPVLLLLPAGFDFLTVILGCLYAGNPAVPAPMPRDARSCERVASIIRDAGIRVVITSHDTVDAVTGLDLPDDARVVTAELVIAEDVTVGNVDRIRSTPTADRVAVIQYTSGSTSEPRGVVVSQANLLHNSSEIQRCIGTGPDLVSVVWLPHFHDMGLVGLLHALFAGGDCVFMDPRTFLRRPVRWLEAVTRWRATMTVAPDFAYEMCARTVTDAQRSTLDLSSLRVALTGAEPVRASTIDRFAQRFGPAGFRLEAFSPCYGMAEMTLLVTAVPPGVRPRVRTVDSRALQHHVLQPASSGPCTDLVSCGRPATLDVQVIDPATCEPCAPGVVGEIWIGGPSMAQGYWRQPEATAEAFGARTTGGAGPFHRSGDLGLLLDGELYLIGRVKDMIIVNGRNLHPQDIEHAVGRLHPALAAASGAVFGLGADAAHLTVVYEVQMGCMASADLAMLASQVTTMVAREFGIPSPSVVFTRRGVVPRTTSGKIQRGRTRSLFLDGGIRALHQTLQPVARAALAERHDSRAAIR